MLPAKLRSAALAMAVVSLVALSACQRMERDSELNTVSRAVELEGKDAVRIDVRMGAGELRVRGGTPKLMEGEFRYRGQRPPIVRYESSSIRGVLLVETARMDDSIPIRAHGEEWTMRLNENVETEMAVKLGAGRCDLDLGRVNLRDLKVNLGAGEVHLDLRGKPRHSAKVRVNGGVGEAVVYLPSDVGLRVDAHGGIGSVRVSGLKKVGDHYENDAYAKDKCAIELSVHGGIGSIRVFAD